jgi:diguanylate cyclase (GGDEF)-like protein
MARHETSGGRRQELARATDDVQREKEDRIHQDADQMAADMDETQADADQASSDADQISSDADQELADREQHASDRDQVAADWELSHASAPGLAQTFEASREERSAARRERESTAMARSTTTSRRMATAALRDELALVRDLTAAARDRTARARDDAATARDRAAEARERRAVEAGNLDDAVVALRTLRVSGASIRQQSGRERIAAAADREAAEADRQHAAADRLHADVDDLTSVFRRGTDELALTHEIDRSRRSGKPLVIAVIEIDTENAVNDKGQPGGDALLSDLAVSSTLRSYDVMVRWGGNEFLCALSDATLATALERVAEIQQALEVRRPGASISVGLAELDDDDTLDSLIARADTDLTSVGCKPAGSWRREDPA